MKKNILLLAMMLLISIPSFGQTHVKNSMMHFSIQVGESVMFTRTGYYQGYEILQTSVRGQVNYGCLMGGIGADFTVGAKRIDINGRIGFETHTDRLGVQAFAAIQRGFGREEGNLTLAGVGVLAEVRLGGPAWLFLETRTMWPMLSRIVNPYGLYNTRTNAFLTLGVEMKF